MLRHLALFWLLLVPTAFAEPDISSGELAGQIKNRLSKVGEFRFIAEEAKKLGVRAWLFGGTAAGYGHYVKWDMQREKGDPRFQPDRFDYDYGNIYRSTQDLDIVVDGSPEQAMALQEKLAEEYPHFQGNKSAWEVRLLRAQIGDKEALLDNPDFLNQHTDSNSTGMIELTEPPKGESAVRDLRDWRSKTPNFLRDVADGKLHFYFSEKHHLTSRARKGLNPPLFAAVRFLTKAFQYELEPSAEDMAKVKKIFRQFNPQKELLEAGAENWLEKNAKKLIQNAVNIEYAWETLREIGADEMLRNLGDVSKDDSLAWWMNKMPLRSHKVGRGKGQTAASIFAEKGWTDGEGRLVLAHETNNFLAHESITRAHTGDANVLISRNGFAGEAAALGDGFYAKVGREGARGTGLTIRLTLAPEAREGADFTRNHDVFVIHNKKAIRVIPESLKLDLEQYFRLLVGGFEFDHSDKALMEKFRRKVSRQIVSPKQYKEIAGIVREGIRSGGVNWPLLLEWMRLPKSELYSEEIFAEITRARNKFFPVEFTEKMEKLPKEVTQRWRAIPFTASDLREGERLLQVFRSIQDPHVYPNSDLKMYAAYRKLRLLRPADAALLSRKFFQKINYVPTAVDLINTFYSADDISEKELIEDLAIHLQRRRETVLSPRLIRAIAENILSDPRTNEWHELRSYLAKQSDNKGRFQLFVHGYSKPGLKITEAQWFEFIKNLSYEGGKFLDSPPPVSGAFARALVEGVLKENPDGTKLGLALAKYCGLDCQRATLDYFSRPEFARDPNFVSGFFHRVDLWHEWYPAADRRNFSRKFFTPENLAAWEKIPLSEHPLYSFLDSRHTSQPDLKYLLDEIFVPGLIERDDLAKQFLVDFRKTLWNKDQVIERPLLDELAAKLFSRPGQVERWPSTFSSLLESTSPDGAAYLTGAFGKVLPGGLPVDPPRPLSFTERCSARFHALKRVLRGQ